MAMTLQFQRKKNCCGDFDIQVTRNDNVARVT